MLYAKSISIYQSLDFNPNHLLITNLLLYEMKCHTVS